VTLRGYTGGSSRPDRPERFDQSNAVRPFGGVSEIETKA